MKWIQIVLCVLSIFVAGLAIAGIRILDERIVQREHVLGSRVKLLEAVVASNGGYIDSILISISENKEAIAALEQDMESMGSVIDETEERIEKAESWLQRIGDSVGSLAASVGENTESIVALERESALVRRDVSYVQALVLRNEVTIGTLKGDVASVETVADAAWALALKNKEGLDDVHCCCPQDAEPDQSEVKSCCKR